MHIEGRYVTHLHPTFTSNMSTHTGLFYSPRSPPLSPPCIPRPLRRPAPPAVPYHGLSRYYSGPEWYGWWDWWNQYAPNKIGFDGDNGGRGSGRLFRSFDVADYAKVAIDMSTQADNVGNFLDANQFQEMFDLALDTVGMSDVINSLVASLKGYRDGTDAFSVADALTEQIEKKYRPLCERNDPTATFSARVFPSHDDGSWQSGQGWYETYSFDVRVDVMRTSIVHVSGNGKGGTGWGNAIGTSRLAVPMILHEYMEVETNEKYSLWYWDWYVRQLYLLPHLFHCYPFSTIRYVPICTPAFSVDRTLTLPLTLPSTSLSQVLVKRTVAYWRDQPPQTQLHRLRPPGWMGAPHLVRYDVRNHSR